MLVQAGTCPDGNWDHIHGGTARVPPFALLQSHFPEISLNFLGPACWVTAGRSKRGWAMPQGWRVRTRGEVVFQCLAGRADHLPVITPTPI